MRKLSYSLLILPAVLALSLSLAAFPQQSDMQSDDAPPAKAPKGPSGPPPKSIAGTWAIVTPRSQGWYNYALIPGEPPMTPWAQEKFAASKPSFGPHPYEDPNDVAYRCFPNAVPRVYAGVQTGMQIVELPGRTLMFFGRNIRQIFTDGRQHPADHHLLWMGHSIGSWDGDTFVVDTVDINDVNWIDRMGHPHSDKMHLIERFKRVDDKTMLMDMTLDDPVAFTKSWDITERTFRMRPNARAGEAVCEDMFANEAFGVKPVLPPME
jgi:hypothetical protein